MKILLIVVGKTDQKWLIDGIGQYTGRLTHFAQFEMQVIPDIRNTKNMDSQTEMAQWLEKRMAQSTKRLVFIIGGPYGFSQDVYNRVPGKLSLSKMTFSHQMVRLIFVEQLYRAFSILNNLPYHHE